MSYYPGPGDWLLSLSATIGVLSLCALVAVPWLAAHLRFWGEREGRKSDLAAAVLLGRWGKFCLAAAFFFGALSFHLASARYPSELFSAAILLAPVLAAVPLFLTAWGGFSGYRKIHHRGPVVECYAMWRQESRPFRLPPPPPVCSPPRPTNPFGRKFGKALSSCSGLILFYTGWLLPCSRRWSRAGFWSC